MLLGPVIVARIFGGCVIRPFQDSTPAPLYYGRVEVEISTKVPYKILRYHYIAILPHAYSVIW